MKTVFLSNYFNHHQKSICEELNRLSESFRFVATSEMREERKKLGYGEIIIPDYVVKYSPVNCDTIKEEVLSSDITIIGSAPNSMIAERIKDSKLIFRYSERPIRNDRNILKYIPRFIKWNIKNPINKPLYLLSASAFASWDYIKFGLFRHKAYKWGYFTEVKEYECGAERIIKDKKKKRILWCARFLKLKHPESVLYVAEKLKNAGYEFCIDMIGIGPMQEYVSTYIEEKKLDGYINLIGAMKPEQVRHYMEQSGIFLFTSDKQEGWGAVLNESMNSGCAVVASHAIGSVPYLIDNGKNGLVYRSGDVEMLYENVKYLLDNPDEQERLGRAAYDTITKEWNAKVAAERLVNLSEYILNGEKHPDLYESGPCSRAEIIKDDWFNE